MSEHTCNSITWTAEAIGRQCRDQCGLYDETVPQNKQNEIARARVDGGLSGDTADKYNGRDLVPSNRARAWMPL